MSSSTSVVDAVGPAGSAPRVHTIDVVFKTRWQPLSDPLTVPPWGPAIDVVFKLGGGHCRTHRQRLLVGPPSMSTSTSVVDTAGPIGNAPQGPAIDVVFKTWW
jgi:hypothetical protein